MHRKPRTKNPRLVKPKGRHHRIEAQLSLRDRMVDLMLRSIAKVAIAR